MKYKDTLNFPIGNAGLCWDLEYDGTDLTFSVSANAFGQSCHKWGVKLDPQYLKPLAWNALYAASFGHQETHAVGAKPVQASNMPQYIREDFVVYRGESYILRIGFRLHTPWRKGDSHPTHSYIEVLPNILTNTVHPYQFQHEVTAYGYTQIAKFWWRANNALKNEKGFQGLKVEDLHIDGGYCYQPCSEDRRVYILGKASKFFKDPKKTQHKALIP
jgi:hypothetical protein